MITIELWKKTIQFIENVKNNIKTDGILLCGSLVYGGYRAGSDIDVLFITPDSDFSMSAIQNGSIIFDKMECNAAVLLEVLSQKSPLSDVLSLSFGSSSLILEESVKIRSIQDLATQNIQKRKLSYIRDKNKQVHVVQESPFTLKRINGYYSLIQEEAVVL